MNMQDHTDYFTNINEVALYRKKQSLMNVKNKVISDYPSDYSSDYPSRCGVTQCW